MPADRYAVLDASGDTLAIVSTEKEAEEYRVQGEMYYDEAATCGNFGAGSWAANRLPLAIVELTAHQAARLLSEEGTPTLQREP